jgi:excisionase family DNA binding protein
MNDFRIPQNPQMSSQGSPSLDSNLSPKQVAQALQVSESSVKRWCDQGMIRTNRTLGGHRRIPVEHLMDFLESTNRRLIDPAAIGLSREREADRAELVQMTSDRAAGIPTTSTSEEAIRYSFETALLAGDEHQCRKAISSWYTIHGGMASVADDLLAPSFQTLGQMWECGKIDIYQERRGCEMCIRLIHELRRFVPDPISTAPLAMGGTAEGDLYQVANQLIDIIFREAGWRTVSLGSGVPFDSMLSAAQRFNPKVFWLSVSHIDDEKLFHERFQSFSRQLPKGVMLVVGGRAMNEALRRKLQFAAYCDSMHQLSTLARNMRGNDPIPGPRL